MKELRWVIILNFILFVNSVCAVPQIMDKIVAIVDNSVILKSEVDDVMYTVKYGAQETNQQLPDNATLRRQILDRLIMDNIIFQQAMRANISVSDEQLDQVIDDIAAHNHMSLDQLYSHLVDIGLDYKTYRAQIHKEMLITKVRDGEVRRRVTILPQEVEALTQQITFQQGNGTKYNLSHIFIPLSDNPTQEQLDKAEALASSVVEQSKSGANFNKLIINYSIDAQVISGSQMGWRKQEDLPSLFVAHLHNSQKGSIIGPIRSSVGFHILKVNDIHSDTQKMVVTEVHVRHILLRTSVELNDQQARDKLEDISVQIKSGSISFAAAAKQMSEDLDSANHGGDLGWNSAEAFDPAFHEVLMHLSKGEISTPVHSSLGWHLIQLIDTRQVDRTAIAQKNWAYQTLFDRKFTEELQTWMQDLRASSYIKILDNNG